MGKNGDNNANDVRPGNNDVSPSGSSNPSAKPPRDSTHAQKPDKKNIPTFKKPKRHLDKDFILVSIKPDESYACFRHRPKGKSCGLDGKPKASDKKEIIMRLKDGSIKDADLSKDWENPEKLWKKKD